MKKYVNYNAIPELDKAYVQKYIRKQIDVLSGKGDADAEDKRLLEKFTKLDQLNRLVSLDWPSTQTKGCYTVKYFDFVVKLLREKEYEKARILCILELKGLDAYLHSDKKFKNIWPQYIAYNRWRKFYFNPKWLADFKPFSSLITDGIITLAQCAKYPFAFTVFVRLRPVRTGYYKAVVECKKITSKQRASLIQFLSTTSIPIEYSVEEIYKIWLRSGSSIYRTLLPQSHQDRLQPEGGFDFVYHAAKSKKLHIIDELKSCPRVFERCENGVYPIEFIMAWKTSRNNWLNQFGQWHSEDDWKQNNLLLLKRRLKYLKLDENAAFSFYVTMQHRCEATNRFHSLKRGSNEQLQQLETASSSFPLSDLPIDIIHVISKHLTLTTVMALTLTCKSVNQLIKTNAETFWRHSLLITCPRSRFNLPNNSKWTEIAIKENKLRHNWIKGLSARLPFPQQTMPLFDENWGLFNQYGTIHHEYILFNCNTLKSVTMPHVELPGLRCDYLFLDSQPDIVPTVVYFNHTSIFIQKADRQVVRQEAPNVLYNGIGFESNKIFFNDFIWDVETATQSLKFDIKALFPFSLCEKKYHEKHRTLLFAKDGQFYVLDPRSGQQTQYALPINKYDLIDDNTIGYVSTGALPVVGTIDLRVMRKHVIHTNTFCQHTQALISGVASKALIVSSADLVVQWDFRERAWDSVFHKGRLLAMNSKQLVLYSDQTWYIQNFNRE